MRETRTQLPIMETTLRRTPATRLPQRARQTAERLPMVDSRPTLEIMRLPAIIKRRRAVCSVPETPRRTRATPQQLPMLQQDSLRREMRMRNPVVALAPRRQAMVIPAMRMRAMPITVLVFSVLDRAMPAMAARQRAPMQAMHRQATRLRATQTQVIMAPVFSVLGKATLPIMATPRMPERRRAATRAIPKRATATPPEMPETAMLAARLASARAEILPPTLELATRARPEATTPERAEHRPAIKAPAGF